MSDATTAREVAEAWLRDQCFPQTGGTLAQRDSLTAVIQGERDLTLKAAATAAKAGGCSCYTARCAHDEAGEAAAARILALSTEPGGPTTTPAAGGGS